MTVTVLRAADHVRMPWANGGGTTYQVMTSPSGAGLDDFDWRISLADIDEGGPFSAFPGVDRILVLVSGAEMQLRIDGAARAVNPLQPVAFAGESEVSCALPVGTTRDLNVMTRRARCTATVAVVDTDVMVSVTPLDDATVLVVVLGGACTIGDSSTAALEPRDAVVVGRTVELVGSATLALVTITDGPIADAAS